MSFVHVCVFFRYATCFFHTCLVLQLYRIFWNPKTRTHSVLVCKYMLQFLGFVLFPSNPFNTCSVRDWWSCRSTGLENYKRKAGANRSYNLDQNPNFICMAGSEDTLGTIIKSTSMPLGGRLCGKLWRVGDGWHTHVADRACQPEISKEGTLGQALYNWQTTEKPHWTKLWVGSPKFQGFQILCLTMQRFIFWHHSCGIYMRRVP